MLWSFIYSLNLFYIEMCRQVWRICMWILGLKGLNTVCFWFIFHTHHFRFILLFKVAKLKYGGREKQNQIKKEEEQKKGADGDTSTADANYSGRV